MAYWVAGAVGLAVAGSAAVAQSAGTVAGGGQAVAAPDLEQGLLRNALADLAVGSHIPEWTQRAEGGDRDALLVMAAAYQEGIGVAPDRARALAYARRAAAAGSVRALGLVCILDTPVNKTVFPQSCTTAAERDVPEGRLAKLTWAAFSGKPGVPRDAASARRLMAAELARGRPEARMLYAEMLTGGFIYPKDVAAGKLQMQLAADAGLADALVERAASYEIGPDFPDTKPEDMKKARAMYVRLARLGDNRGLTWMAQKLIEGDGFDQNKKLGAEFYNLAATQGDTDARLRLAFVRLDRETPYFSVVEAEKELATYEKGGNTVAPVDLYAMLGRHYREGDGVTRDLGRASDYFTRCAEDDGSCAIGLAGIYEEIGDRATALKWYRKAETLGEAGAAARIAVLAPAPTAPIRRNAPPEPIRRNAPPMLAEGGGAAPSPAPARPLAKAAPPAAPRAGMDFESEITRYILSVALERGDEVRPANGWSTELVTPHPLGGYMWHTFRSATKVKCAKVTAASYRCSYQYNKMIRPDPASMMAQLAFAGMKFRREDEVNYQRTDMFTVTRGGGLASATLKAWMNTPTGSGTQTSSGSSSGSGSTGYQTKTPDFRETWNGYMCATTNDPCGY
jgi:TPR repeat protein